MPCGTVLLVEDSKTQARLIGIMIEKIGWKCVISYDLKTAFGLLKNNRFDLLLCDVYVSGGNTLLNLPELRQLSLDTPIAIMSAGDNVANGVNSTLDQARLAQADYVLAKPFNLGDLQAIFNDAKNVRRHAIKTPHILIIDQDALIRNMMTKTLVKKGYRVSEVRSMNEALARSDMAHIDLVITDLCLIGMSAAQGIDQIHKAWPEMVIVTMQQDLQKSQAAQNTEVKDIITAASKFSGIEAHMTKPFSPKELTACISSVLKVRYLAI